MARKSRKSKIEYDGFTGVKVEAPDCTEVKVEAHAFTDEQKALLTTAIADVDKAYRVNRQPNVSNILGRAIAALKDLEATSQ